MGLLAKLFGDKKMRVLVGGSGSAAPPRFSREAYEQETVRAIIDCIASHTAKAEAMHVVLDSMGRVKEIKRDSPYVKLLNQSPNPLMSGYDLKYKLITQLETNTTAMVYVKWGGADDMQPVMMLPVPYRNFDIFPIQGGGYAVQFVDEAGEVRYLNVEDVVLLRKYFNNNEVAGDGNGAVRMALELANASNAAFLDAVAVGNKVRGILRSKKAMLADADVEAATAAFAAQYAKAAKAGGIIGVDAQAEYVPLPVTPWAANAAQLREIRGNLLRYWRMSESILSSDYSEGQWQAFYESVIEPHLIRMGQAFTATCFTPKERAHGNRIMFVASTLMHTSIQTKLQLLSATRETGLFTINEAREMFGYAPVEDGDKRLVSLNYVNATKQDEYQTGAATEGAGEQEGDTADGQEQAAGAPV